MIDKILRDNKYDSFFHFLEKRFIKWLIIIIALIILLSKLLLLINFTPLIPLLTTFDLFISENLVTVFKNRDSTLVSLSAIFIGIYFTTFTLMATISVKSTFSVLKKQQFSNLIRYIKNAFIASFSYLIISMTLPTFSGWVFSSVSLLLLIYMLLSAFRFGGLIYMILIRDIDRYIDNVEVENLKIIKQERILDELEKFLVQQKNIQQLKQADDISKLLQERKLKQSQNEQK